MNISDRDRALLGVVTALAALAALAAFYVLALAPQRRTADQLSRSIAAAHTTLATAQSDYADGRSAQARLSLTTADYTAAQRAVPRKSDIPALLRLLQRTADAAHVTIDTVSLDGSGSSSSTSASTAPTTATGVAAVTAATAQPVPVSLTFGGGYQALNRMVHQLDGLVRVSHGHLRADGPLVGIGNVALSTGTSTGSPRASSLTVTLSADIYQYADASTVTGPSSEGTS